VDEALRRGDTPAVVRGRMRRELTMFLEASPGRPADRVRHEGSEAVRQRLETRGGSDKPGFIPPGIEKTPGGPAEVAPEVPYGPGDNNENPGAPDR